MYKEFEAIWWNYNVAHLWPHGVAFGCDWFYNAIHGIPHTSHVADCPVGSAADCLCMN